MQVLQSREQGKVRLEGSRGPGPGREETAWMWRKMLSFTELSDIRLHDLGSVTLLPWGSVQVYLRIKCNMGVSHQVRFWEERLQTWQLEHWLLF